MNTRAIISATAQHYATTRGALVAHDRHQPLALHRQVAMYLCRMLTPCTYESIGRAFGNRDHGTISHGVQVVAARLGHDAALRADIAAISFTLRRANPGAPAPDTDPYALAP